MKLNKASGFIAAVASVLVAAGLYYALQGLRQHNLDASIVPTPGSDAQEAIARGAYLARAGNCIACHTVRGGPAYAGGRGIETPFGMVYSRNLTPDTSTGLGTWTANDFWLALHEGRATKGRLLYPACPYPSFTYVTRQDSDALFAYFRSLAPVERTNKDHALRFPYNTQSALVVWRAVFFSPGVAAHDERKSDAWNRGAYLVNGLGHCAACHAPRNAFGATKGDLALSGGHIPMQKWAAPSLATTEDAGVANWEPAHLVQLLKTGVSPRQSVAGPMAEVVFSSTQYLSDADLNAMVAYLQDLPTQSSTREATAPEPPERIDPRVLETGSRIYEQQCADCHGKHGEGSALAYPALAGSALVARTDPTNLVRIIVSGGFPPTTQGNPQPYGMPPFGATLSDLEIAAAITYIRNSWGNAAPAVVDFDVMRAR
jgi:mono/diheme cytochrome c family protein